MARKRDPGYITNVKTDDFGFPVTVRDMIPAGSNPGISPSGDPAPGGGIGFGVDRPNNIGRAYRQVIPPGEIGSRETRDSYEGTLRQYPKTFPYDPKESRDPSLHNSAHAMGVEDDRPIEFHAYGALSEPRRAPMPRNVSDDLYLRGYGRNVADPRMEDANWSDERASEKPDIVELFDQDRDGVPHNEGHPGFAAVQSKIASREGISKDRAGAILANASRHASTAAKKKNPHLKRVKG